ncbi:ABC transporter B family member 24, mitochondrial [Nosema granulosis]|uniref:ABC transporter B family member 24, mitochondrial n=1 Tax=Nosema granulosis TaxID=83296 RepID=A0A9P6GZ67_9MICR|nr:ABC transporter B family member 24, mitochondrial [Nosema granulosis]
MEAVTNKDVLYNALVTYGYNIPYIRYSVPPVLLFTFLASFLEVHSSYLAKSVTNDLVNSHGLTKNIILYMLCYSGNIIITEFTAMAFSGPIQYVYKVVGVEAFNYYISLDPESYSAIGNGEIQMIIERRSRAYGDIIEYTFTSLLPVVILSFTAFCSVYLNLGRDALIVMLISGVLYVFVTVIFSVLRMNIKKSYNQALDVSSNKLQDYLSNQETIIAYNRQESAIDTFDSTQIPVEKFAILNSRYLYFLYFLQKSLFVIQTAVIVILGVYGRLSSKIDAKELIYYLSISKTLNCALAEMGTLYTKYIQGFLNAKSGHFGNQNSEYNDKVVRNVTLEKAIEFKDVSFAYRSTKLFENMNFKINKGEKVAIIGKNGTGKSTLLKVLLKFYKHEGQILLDGVDINNIHETHYRKVFSYATQNTYLFDGTIKYNIKYGNKFVSDEEIYVLAKKLNIHESIQKLSKGYDSYVGERGRLLSGGERQKVLFMRALLKDSKVLLLDEPTSALDKIAESEVITKIMSEYSDKTVVMILHNLDLLHMFDKVLLVKDKRVQTIENVDNKMKLKGIFDE